MFFQFFLRLWVVSFIWVSTPSEATTFISRPFGKVLEETPLLIRGRAGVSNVVWIPSKDGGKSTATITPVEVIEILKGNLGNLIDSPQDERKILVRELGGLKEGEGLEIAGTAHFTAGEEVVLTLRPMDENGYYPLIGLSTGRYTIERREDGREYLVGFGIQDQKGVPQHGEVQINHAGSTDEDSSSYAKSLSRSWTLEELRAIRDPQERRGAVNISENTKSPHLAENGSKVQKNGAGTEVLDSANPSSTSENLGENANEKSDLGLEGARKYSRVILILAGVLIGFVFYRFGKFRKR